MVQSFLTESTGRKAQAMPGLWLALQAVIIAIFMMVSGRFDLKITHDSGAYLDYFSQSGSTVNFLQDILSHYRTFGYPLFVKIVSFFDPAYKFLPVVQYLVYLIAVGIFWNALKDYGFPKWTAFAAAAPLLYSRMALKYSSNIMSDTLATSGVLIVFAILFRLAAAPGKRFLWIGLALMLFLVCQVRPIYLFLLPLVPVLGVLFVLYRRIFFSRPLTFPFSHREKGQVQILKFFLGCVAAGFLPFLFFCLLRALVVGQFGYTSYSGITLGGVAVPLLTEEVVPKLTEDIQPLARRMIEKRTGGSSIGIDGHEIKWEPVKGKQVHWSDLRRWLYANPDYVGGVAVASARELYGGEKSPGGWLIIDRNLKELALELIKLRPLVYAQLVFLSIQKSLTETINTNLLFQFSLIMFILSRLGHFVVPDKARAGGKMADVMLLLGTLFFFTKIFVAALVQTPQARYYIAAEIFLPSIFTVAAAAPWEKIQNAAFRKEEEMVGAKKYASA